MIVDRIELSNIARYKRDMMVRLADFSDHHHKLRHLNIEEADEQHENVTFIKNEVIDLADRFEVMQKD